jgi:hypothetical protein
MCLVSGYDLGFLTREQAVERITLTLSTLEKLEHHESGFPYNYYDTTTAERTSYFVSLVDSGWLVAGYYVVKQAFPKELGDQAQSLIDRGSVNFFTDFTNIWKCILIIITARFIPSLERQVIWPLREVMFLRSIGLKG